MIEFDFDRVLSNWWEVTGGRTLDDIEFTVTVDGDTYNGTYCHVDDLVALYECTVREIPSAEHPHRTTYDLRETADAVEMEIGGRWVATSYGELRAALASFLGELFAALDEQSDDEDREEAVGFMGSLEMLLPFEEVYETVTERHEESSGG